ncbi:uncharacterized protein LOC125498893 [Beta vulgaris subsp. vulgaris]|uniref:uncharacterized protein LOC125498893 n=1 Tax=Beta vulgaris subsp. vulgaris TaxID=3555 RepID=UPI002036DEC6|nr:uncharacterized protein LOC125498893 [Beta vulgaris subsp. vulgaris]
MGPHEKWRLFSEDRVYAREGRKSRQFSSSLGEYLGFGDQPKVRHFLWRLCTNSLPVRDLLKYRHLIEEADCPWGCGEAETMAHAIFGCQRVKDLWDECGCEVMCTNAMDVPMCDLLVSWQQVDPKVRRIGMFLAWVIWGERNKKVFDNHTTPLQVLVNRVKRLTEEHDKYASRIYHTLPSRSVTTLSKTWCPPPHGIVKLNVDASLSVEGWIGLGVVARDSTGQVLFAATRRIKAFWAPEVAEAKAIALGLKLGKRYGLQEIIVESDCQVVIHRLSKSALFLSDLDLVLHDIFSLCSSFSSLSWSHVKRDENFVAHHLAKLIPFGVEQVWENHYPVEVAPYVLVDNLVLN